MSEEENLNFFNKVRNKKIKWSSWSSDEWFIPKKLIGHFMDGDVFFRGVPEKREIAILNGFNNYDSGKWIFLQETKNKPNWF